MRISKLSVALVCAFLIIHSSLAQTSPQDFVDAHNEVRSSEGVGPIAWDETVANYARNYANLRSQDCLMKHSDTPYGENLFEGGGDATAKQIVDYWASEKQYWDNNTKTCAPGEQCGHYLQVVDPGSVQLGCARVKCKNDDWYWFVTCNYNGPGSARGHLY
ncbi:hypothetical protein DCAR_0520081 [Daucus carota subsp. sativus]|uniref:Uncharacterized protein n=1 Tax=Daucus carota subsp. sativus TaxID=79200 RepID=A0A164YAF8_DAUCS|nr:hypothetical protein DCAR_0520081 [Daucus carota subsp. sativus]